MPLRPTLIAALQSAGLYLAGFFVPLLGPLAVLFAPVPLIIATVLHGRASGLFAAGIAAILIAAAGSWQASVVLFFAGYSLMGLAIADSILRNRDHETAVLFGGLVPLLFLALVLAPVLLQGGKGPGTMAEDFLRSSVSDTRALYAGMGMTEVVQTLDALDDRIIRYAVRLLPGVLIAASLFQAAVCYGIGRTIILRRRPDRMNVARTSLAQWHAPDQWVWVLIASLGCVALAPRDSAAWFIGLNLIFPFLLIYAAQGIALVDQLLRRIRIPTLWRSVVHAIIMTMPTAVAVIALGVVDIWADFRKVRMPRQRT